MEGGFTFFRRIFFCLTVQKNFVGEPFDVSENFVYRKNIMDRKGVGVGYRKFRVSISFMRKKVISIFSVETFFVSKCQKNSWETSQCFRHIRVSKNFMHKKGVSLFSVEIFCLRVPKKFVGEPFCVSKKFWYRKFSCIGEEDITVLSKKVLSHTTETKNLVREPSCIPENLWYRKDFMGKRGGYHDFAQ